MKKLLLGVVALGLVATSCKKDDDNESSSAMLVGTWKFSKYVTVSGKDGAILDSETVSGCGAQDTTEFRSDKTVIDKGYSSSGTNGACSLSYTDTGNYSYNEGTKEISVTWAGNASADIAKVESISHSQLVIYSMDGDSNGDGFNDKFYVYLYK